jgi:hypothetical protein
LQSKKWLSLNSVATHRKMALLPWIIIDGPIKEEHCIATGGPIKMQDTGRSLGWQGMFSNA